MMKKISSSKISKASNVRKIHPVYFDLAESLSQIDKLQFIKIYNGRLCASNLLSNDKKKEPITKYGQEDVVGVQLLIDADDKTIQFYSITSSEKGYGGKIVESIVSITPNDWTLVVAMDWSGGFWQRIQEDYPQIIVL